MVGKVLDVLEIITPDQLGNFVATKWIEWNNLRQPKLAEWKEVRGYIFATDTTKTSNSILPWNNKTTIPKLTQIRDNLFANYIASMFPKRNWMAWEADNEQDQEKQKSETIESYMSFVINQSEVRQELEKLVYDFIDFGNAFAMPEWRDDRILDEEGQDQIGGYVGPAIRRISPLDLVFNPTASSFRQAPKIIRTFMSLGEVKALLEQETKDTDDKELAEELWNYLRNIRKQASKHDGPIVDKDGQFQVEGFGSFFDYLKDDVAEILTFYGDYFDHETGELFKNYIITVVDRHKLISKRPNPSFFGYPPIFHVGWRGRQDNLWAMGPLDNLVGMQYRIDHLENLKADIFDLTAYPVQIVRGYVEDFEWQPNERIYVGDDGDVELRAPDVQALQANFEISGLEQKMEEMAGAPKQALGFRTPGEKTAFEVSSLENAASRIFQSKVLQFEQQMTEPLLNGMLELARRNMTSATIRVLEDELKVTTFPTLTVEDITGTGRIKPKAAQHFAERAQIVQNLTNLFNSPLGADEDIKLHFSGIKLAQLVEELLEIENRDLVQPYVRIGERADAERQAAASQELFAEELQTPSGLFPDDFDDEVIDEALETEGAAEGEDGIPVE